jgi:hypothetical protein
MTLTGWILLAVTGLALFGFAMVEIGKQGKKHPTEANNYSSSRANETNQQNAENRTNKEEYDAGNPNWLSAAEKHSGVFLVIVTGLLVLMTAFLWRATDALVQGSERIGDRQIGELKKSADAAMKAAKAAEDSVRHAMATTHLEQRAWVAHTGIEGAPETGREFEAVVTIQNTGRTFAKNLKFMIVHETLPKGKLPDFSVEDAEGALEKVESVILLAPDAKTGFPTKNDVHEPITQPQVDSFRSGEQTLFVHGKMTYDDIFGCPHWTTFCYRLLPHNFRYRTYEKHNDSDDNQCR